MQSVHSQQCPAIPTTHTIQAAPPRERVLASAVSRSNRLLPRCHIITASLLLPGSRPPLPSQQFEPFFPLPATREKPWRRRRPPPLPPFGSVAFVLIQLLVPPRRLRLLWLSFHFVSFVFFASFVRLPADVNKLHFSAKMHPESLMTRWGKQ